MKYLKNPETNQIVKSNEFGPFFDSWIELTQDEIDAYELEEAKKIKINQCKAYLNNTDWQIIALTERNRVVDEDVAINRPLAVSLQAEITACTTLEELNNININFE
jgi:hypothetical protein